ncbi:hypothetical protein [Actinomadura sp. NTSP31]|uniref:Rv1733c family protein n=1 Tax=Actinomadura sp. NTSP31 TaxID=1735447 RepID=UPI0035C1B9C4
MTSAHLHRVPEGLQRLRRRFGFDNNDLRRSVDRRQWAVGLTATVAFAAIALPLCAGMASLAHRSGVRAEAAQTSTHHLVDARVARTETENTGQVRYSFALLTWTTPDGRAHWTTLPARKSMRPGTVRRVWVDGSGEPTRRPQSHADTVTATAFAGTAAVGAAGAPPLAVYLLVRRRCERRRARMWEADWARLDRRQVN